MFRFLFCVILVIAYFARSSVGFALFNANKRKVATSSPVKPFQNQNTKDVRGAAALFSHQELTPIGSEPGKTTDLSKSPFLPCGDKLDLSILSLAIPAILNLAIIPLVGAVDTFYVGKMNNPYALAGQGAANQIFSSSFWLFSFLPLVTTPLVAAAAGSNDDNAVRERIAEAVFVGTIVGALGSLLLGSFPGRALSLVLGQGAKAGAFAEPYLRIRALTFVPALLSTVGFAAFRGKMNVLVPLKISLISNLVNVLLDPLLIFTFKMGVSGAAAATCISEVVGFVLYVRAMVKEGMLSSNILKLFSIPRWKTLKPLLMGGASVQLRSISIEIAYLALTRASHASDASGISAAAHSISMQIWLLAGIVLFALSTVSSILVPAEMAKSLRRGLTSDSSGKVEVGKEKEKRGSELDLTNAKRTADRLFAWGGLLGLIFSGLQIAAIPLVGLFSPLPAVKEAARIPTMIGACLQLFNGVVFVGEGIQQGNQYFGSLALTSVVATTAMLGSLALLGRTLTGVWISLAVFFLARLMGVLRHYFFSGPFAKWEREKALPVI